MRTTLNLDRDVYLAARRLSERRQISLGAVISELVRSALTKHASSPAIRNGVTLFPNRKTKTVVTLELVNQLRDDE